MKVIYNPFYDEGYYVDLPKRCDKLGCVIGELYVGNNGLLDELELRAGLHGNYPSDLSRETDYLTAMKKHCKGSFFEKAASVDEMGVAAKLMKWRDSLIMAGWVKDKCGIDKIDTLADIEQDFKATGYADRWLNVLEYYKKVSVIKQTVIEVTCAKQLIPPLIGKVLDCIEEKCKDSIHWMDNTESDETLHWPDHLQLIHFATRNEAYDWLVSNIDQKNDVVINRNNFALNNILYSWGKPLVNSQCTNSNLQIIQLFKLSVDMFCRPLNAENLLSYLQLPKNPLPSALRRQLAEHLVKEGGIGKEWDKIIEDYEREDKSEKTNKTPFINPVKAMYTEDSIPVEDISRFCTLMVKWTHGLIDHETDDNIIYQLSTVASFFTTLSDILKNKENISSKDLRLICATIYRPVTVVHETAQKNSITVVNGIECLIDMPERLIWADCSGVDIPSDEYDFLTSGEKTGLKQHGVLIPDYMEMLSLRNAETIRQMNRMKDGTIILLMADYDGITRLDEHPVISSLHAMKEDDEWKRLIKEETVSQPMEEGEVQSFSTQLNYQLNQIDYNGRTESYSSIDTLINHPFDYVMNYIARLRESSAEEMKNINAVIGTVAHYVIEKLVNDSDGDINFMRNHLQSDYDSLLDEALMEKGIMLLLPENASQLTGLKLKLKKSINAIFDICSNNNLTPVQCEHSFCIDDLIDIGPFNGSIDMLLETKDKKYVIIDMKWSENSHYKTKLSENTALQLEIYRAALEAEGKTVVATGYYLMPLCLLYTCDTDIISGTNVKAVKCDPVVNDLRRSIQNSFRYRMQEIRNGLVEEAENMPLKDGGISRYYDDTKEKELVPLDKIKKFPFTNKKRKINSKSEQTTHPIQKGRVK